MIKRRITITLALVVALILGMTTMVFAEMTDETTATVEFEINPEVNKLELVDAPTIDFGLHELPSGSTNIEAETITDDLTIMDTTGNFDGWDVTARLGKFTTAGVPDSMPGAYITLDGGTAQRTGSGVTAAPDVVNSITLISNAGSSTNVVNAAENAGIGTWSVKWLAENVTLSILDTPATGLHTATINWTLTAGPTK